MKRLSVFICIISTTCIAERMEFDTNGKLHHGDSIATELPSFDDGAWRVLDVPHDWSIEGDYAKDNPMGGTAGYLPAGIGWYHKTIPVSKDWKTYISMNTSWGYSQFDVNWKSSETLIRNLIDVVSKGGNFLLNVGPEADGRIPEASIDGMKAIGQWMDINGESIYGTQASTFGKPKWGRYTTKSGKFYAQVFDWPENGTLSMATAETPVTRAYLLADKDKSDLNIKKGPDGWLVQLPKKAPDAIASVIVIEHN